MVLGLLCRLIAAFEVLNQSSINKATEVHKYIKP
jgi:hypothetical protein